MKIRVVSFVLSIRDAENVTITANRTLSKKLGKQKSQECVANVFLHEGLHSTRLPLHRDLRLLAVSTHMTELSYAISDIQTRIFGAHYSCQFLQLASA